MDINLPDASGLDLTRTLKDSNSEVEVIIFTNHDGPEYREAAVHSGASHFVTKWDIRIDEITSLVASALSAWNRKCQTDAVSARCCT